MIGEAEPQGLVHRVDVRQRGDSRTDSGRQLSSQGGRWDGLHGGKHRSGCHG